MMMIMWTKRYLVRAEIIKFQIPAPDNIYRFVSPKKVQKTDVKKKIHQISGVFRSRKNWFSILRRYL